jgi:hypothetical protein
MQRHDLTEHTRIATNYDEVVGCCASDDDVPENPEDAFG